jgi:uncharacterized protein YkwD
MILMGLMTATGNLWVKEHHSLEMQVAAMRQQHGLAPLPESHVLTDLATEHSWRMAKQRQIFHSSSWELSQPPAPWSAIGEIVGVASQPWQVIRAFMDSPEHRDVLLGDWTEIGFGHIRGDGRVWVTLWFKK